MIRKYLNYIKENKKYHFDIGDEVIFRSNSSDLTGWSKKELLNGLIGKIINKENDYCGVEFEKHINGHDCQGNKLRGKYGYCFWVDPSYLEHLDPKIIEDRKKKRRRKKIKNDGYRSIWRR